MCIDLDPARKFSLATWPFPHADGRIGEFLYITFVAPSLFRYLTPSSDPCAIVGYLPRNCRCLTSRVPLWSELLTDCVGGSIKISANAIYNTASQGNVHISIVT